MNKELFASLNLDKKNLDKKNAIFNSAAQEFALYGYKGANINTISKQAGIGKGSIYLYFENKSELYLITVQEAVRLAEEMVEEIFKQEPNDFFKFIEKLLLITIEYNKKYPYFYKLYSNFTYGPDTEFKKEVSEITGRLTTRYILPQLNRAIKLGQVRDSLDVDTACFMIDALVNRFQDACVLPYLDIRLGVSMSDKKIIQKRVREFIDILQNGLC